MHSVSQKTKPVLVMGIGNSIQKDDGVGIHVIQELCSHDIPEDVEILDGGTAGVDLVRFLKNRKQVILIDAVNGEQPPGTIFRFTPNDLKTRIDNLDSLHSVGILETLEMAKLMRIEPEETIIIGVQPKKIDWGLEPTSEIRAVIPRVLEIVEEEIQRAVLTINGNNKTKMN